MTGQPIGTEAFNTKLALFLISRNHRGFGKEPATLWHSALLDPARRR